MNTTAVNNENNIDKKYPEHKEVLTTITLKEFCVIWKKISNDKRIRPYSIERKLRSGDSYQSWNDGWIYPTHHIIYNMIRGLPFDRGFKKNSEGFNNALASLKQQINSGSNYKIFEPFKEFMSLEKFIQLSDEYRLILCEKEFNSNILEN